MRPERAGPAAVILCLVLGLALSAALMWPLPLHLGSWHAPNSFGASHAWVAAHTYGWLIGERALTPTAELGFPWAREGTFIGWGCSLAGVPLQPLVGALATGQILTLLSLPLSAVAAWALIRRTTTAGPWVAVPCALAYGFSPYLLGTLRMGELPKLQAWFLPVFLLAALEVLRGRRSAGAWLAGVTGVVAFTSPYYGLVLPLLAGGLAVHGLARRRWREAAQVLAAVAAALAPAYLYFSRVPAVREATLFQPATVGSERVGLVPSPKAVATVQELLFGGATVPANPYEAMHVVYLGLPVLVVALAIGAVRRSRGLGLALALVAFGVVAALGTRLVWTDTFTDTALPMAWLEWFRYPYHRGGMYFRLVVVASLGLSLAMAAACSGGGRRWAALAWVLGAVQVGDGLRETGPWPMTTEPVPHGELMRSIAGRDGAVLHLPPQDRIAQTAGQLAMLWAMLHQRPTSALPRNVTRPEMDATKANELALLAQPDAAARLRERGYRYVVLDTEAPSVPRRVVAQLAVLDAEQVADGPLSVWDLGPARPEARSLDEVLSHRKHRTGAFGRKGR